MEKGRFITFEGNDGCGKTTIIKEVAQILKNRGLEVVVTREPGGIEISESIRNIILDPKNTKMDGRTEALLYAASRRQHLVEKVIPALEAGKIVLCDRFVDSSLAYQGVARGLGIDIVMEINRFAIVGHMPDRTVFLQIDPELGLKRIKERKEIEDRLDAESLSFHCKVAEGYQQVIKLFPERIKVVDASLSIEEVSRSALSVIEGVLE